MLRKPLNKRSSCLEVFYKKSALKNSQENPCARVSLPEFSGKVPGKDCNFIKKRLQHRYFSVKYVKFILQNTAGGINKKAKFTSKESC